MSSGTKLVPSNISLIFVVNVGTVTSFSTALPCSSRRVTFCVCSGMVISAPCIDDLRLPLGILIVIGAGSLDAKKFCKPRLLKIGGNFTSLCVLNLKSSLKNSTGAVTLFFGACGIPSGFSALPVCTKIVFSFMSLLSSADALGRTSTIVVKGVSTILAFTFSSAVIVGFLKNLIGWLLILVDKSIFRVVLNFTLYVFWKRDGTSKSTLSGSISPRTVSRARPSTLTGGL